LLESVFNPHASSHGLSGAELIRLPLNALTSNQKDNCNTRPSSLGPLLIRYKRKCGGETESHMTLFNKVFSTSTLVQIICVLGAVVVMKAMSAHYDFSWAAALAAE